MVEVEEVWDNGNGSVDKVGNTDGMVGGDILTPCGRDATEIAAVTNDGSGDEVTVATEVVAVTNNTTIGWVTMSPVFRIGVMLRMM